MEEELRHVFQKYARGDGVLNRRELRAALAECGMEGNRGYVQSIIEDADTDGDGQLDEEEFLQIFGYSDDNDFDESEAHTVFSYYAGDDEEMHCGELRRALLSLGLASGRKAVRRMLANADADGSGTLDRQEFVKMMRMLAQQQAEEAEEEWSGGQVVQGLMDAAVGMFGGAFFGGGNGFVEQQQSGGGGAPPPSLKPEFTKALFVGVNYPGTSATLRGCINDVRTIRNLLERTLKFPIKDTRILVDQDADSFTGNKVQVGKPTKAEIQQGIKWLVAGAKAGDTLFFHYSGHGTHIDELVKGSEASGFDEAICPCDYDTCGVIRDDDLRKLLVNGLPPGVRVTAVFDCCHSGTILDLPYVADFGSRDVHSNPRSNSTDAASVLMFSGCRDDQTSADAFVHQRDAWGGALTTAIATLLSENRKGLAIRALLDKMREQMTEGGYTQVPQLSSTHPFQVTGTFSFFGSSVEEL